MLRRTVLTVGFLLASVPAFAKGPFVSQIEGDKVIIVKTADGKNLTAGQGTELNIGDHLRTGPHTSAVIVYPDGSKIFLGRGSDLTLQENNGQTQWNTLSYGQIRGLVKKPAGGGPAGPPRFGVRSRAVVMGVRGTDFVFGVKEAVVDSELHTLDGLVDVAKDEQALMSGKGVSVAPGQAVHATEAVLEPARRFNREEYMQQFERAQPEVVALVRNDPDASSRQPLATQAELEQQPTEKPRPRLQFWMFQVNALGDFQDPKHISTQKTGALVTGQVSWNPTLRLLGPIHLRGHLGLAPLKENTGKLFLSGQAAGLVSLVFFDHVVIEAGAGGEVWMGKGPMGSLILANLAYKFGYEGFFERIFVGTGFYDHKYESGTSYGNRATALVRAGVGIQF